MHWEDCERYILSDCEKKKENETKVTRRGEMRPQDRGEWGTRGEEDYLECGDCGRTYFE